MLFLRLPQVKELTKILDIPRFWGPLITVTFTVAYHLLISTFGWTPAVGWVWLFVVAGSLVGGLRAGLVAASAAAFYSWLIISPGDGTQFVQRVIIGFLMALTVGWLRRRERREADALRVALADARAAWDKAQEGEEAIRTLDGLNGNIERVKQARNKVRELAGTADLPKLVIDELLTILHTLNNVLNAVEGWQQYAQLRERMGKEKIE